MTAPSDASTEPVPASRTARFERTVLLPLGVYVAITLVVPLLNGAGAHPAFWIHSLEVAAVATTLVVARMGLAVLARAARAARRRP